MIIIASHAKKIKHYLIQINVFALKDFLIIVEHAKIAIIHGENFMI